MNGRFLRPTRTEIRLGALRRNFDRIARLAGAGCSIMAVVKAEAYGHGIVRVCRELFELGARYAGVGFIEEAMILRQSGYSGPILIFGSPPNEALETAIDNHIDLTIVSSAKAREASRAARLVGKRARIHLKIDTGMERLGTHWYDCQQLVDEVAALDNLEILGIYTHFATADCDIPFAKVQLERFHEALAYLSAKGIQAEYTHAANSAGLLNLPESRFSMVRPGILMYGYEPGGQGNTGVEPVMRLVSRIAFIKETRAGAGVSYGRTWCASRNTRIATIPIGYGDGYSRLLSNKGRVLIGGKTFPVVGRVCMDSIMVDVGPQGQEKEGDEVLLFGQNGPDGISGEAIAQEIGTISYELTCMIGVRVPRVYVED